jgi:hypothetical protein
MVATKHQEVHKYQRVIDPKNVAAKIYSSLFSFLSLSLSLSSNSSENSNPGL